MSSEISLQAFIRKPGPQSSKLRQPAALLLHGRAFYAGVCLRTASLCDCHQGSAATSPSGTEELA